MNAPRWGFLLIAEAWWELLRAKVRLRVASGRARWLTEVLDLHHSSKSPENGMNSVLRDGDGMTRVLAAVERASRYHLRPMRCLNRSLALLGMLRRRGIAATLRLGCRRHGDDFDFHAWLVDDAARILFNAPEQNTFLPLQLAGRSRGSRSRGSANRG